MEKLSKILIIDTSTKYIYLSLVIDGLEKHTVYQEGINNHSVTIIPLLKEMLFKENLTLQDLTEVVIGVGPGSYTGVRIGVTVSKMIGYLNNIKVKTISSLALIASSSDSIFVIPYIDARRGNAFMAAFENIDGLLKRVEKDCLENIDEYKSNHKSDYKFIESGIPNIKKIFKSDLLTEVKNVHELIPNYLRITEAERNKNITNGSYC